MAESEIPADIRDTAEKAAEAICERIRETQGAKRLGHVISLPRFIAIQVEGALLAERERCAVLAEGYNFPGLGETLGTSSDIINSTALEIAAAIRQDNPNETEPGNG